MDKSLIVRVDFNFTMSTQKIWGAGKSEDTLTYFFIAKFEEMKLVDAVPNVMIPTLSNGRCGGGCGWEAFFTGITLCG